MWGAFRWTARFLLLVMLVPAFGPMAMACASQPAAMHCMRKPVAARAEQSAMPCHHGMAAMQSTVPEPAETSFQAANDGNCCPNHCCCGATTSEWAQPASSLLSYISLLIEPAPAARGAVLRSSGIFGHDSARAPPRS